MGGKTYEDENNAVFIPEEKKDKGVVEIICVLDRSGSMSATIVDAIGGFNTFLEDQRKNPKDVRFTVVFFDHEYDMFKENVSVKEMKNFTNKTYVPRGSTALLDAIGRTINYVKERIEKEKPEKVIFVILTDGCENSSKEFSHKQIQKMIKEQQKKNWEILYLGATDDAYEIAGDIGVQINRTMQFTNTSDGNAHVYRSLTNAVNSYSNNMDYDISEDSQFKGDCKNVKSGTFTTGDTNTHTVNSNTKKKGK